MMKKIEKLPPLFEEILNDKTGTSQGLKVRHAWQTDIWNKVNECSNQINFIIDYLTTPTLKSKEMIRPSFDEVVDTIRGKDSITCSCNTLIDNMEDLTKHYNMGHFDKEK